MKFGADTFDRVMLAAVLVLMAALGFVLGRPSATEKGGNRVLEAELARQARVALVEKVYAPVEELRSQPQLALLKLEEISRKYPGEAHGLILKGEVLQRIGAREEAAASFAEAVRINPEYLDRHSLLSRRKAVETLLAEVKDPPPRLVSTVAYLRSRLAGGCE